VHLPPCANKETIGIGKCLFLGFCLGIMEQTTGMLLRFCCSVVVVVVVVVVAVVVCLFVSLFFVQ